MPLPTFVAFLVASALQASADSTPRLRDTLAVPGRAPSRTTPPGGDTTGYWQQRADYRIVASLHEPTHEVSASGMLTYVNRSPDTLRELYLHQYLNAFRPGSASVSRRRGVESADAWSAEATR